MKLIRTTQIIIEDSEVSMIIKCLKYCQHRLNDHGMTGIERALTESQRENLYKMIAEIDENKI